MKNGGLRKATPNTLPVTASIQAIQCATDYRSLPDVRTMTISEIQFFYTALAPGLIRAHEEAAKAKAKAKRK